MKGMKGMKAVCWLLLVLLGVVLSRPRAIITLGDPKYHNATVLSQIYVLNLDRRIDKMANLTRDLNAAGLFFSRFPAIDGKMAFDGHANQIKLHPKTKFDFVHWSSIRQEPNAYGTTGCWLSHMMAYFNISERVRLHGEPDLPVLILEDDIYLVPNATSLINQAARSLPDDWELFFVGFKNDYCYYAVSPYLCRGSMILDTHAYIVRNASVAEKLIQYANRDSPQVADIYWIPLFKDILHIYLLRPTEVIRQNKELRSDIGSMGATEPPSSPPPPPPPPLSNSLIAEPRNVDDLLALQRLLSSPAVEAAGNILPSSYDSEHILEVFFLEGFANNSFARFVGQAPVVLYELDLDVYRLGAGLGNLMQAACVADRLGLHFVAFSRHSRNQQNAITAMSSSASTSKHSYLPLDSTFVQALPTVLLHSLPAANRNSVAAFIRSSGGRKLLQPRPWKQPGEEACWAQQQILSVSMDSLRRAVIDQVRFPIPSAPAYAAPEREYGPQVLSQLSLPADTFHDPHVAVSSPPASTTATSASPGPGPAHAVGGLAGHAAAGKHRRLIPDAVVVFRCADILHLNDSDYGLLNFHAYQPLIPAAARDIYILSEPLHHGPWGAVCLDITRALADFLEPRYPNATVLVRRGFVFDSMAMVMLAPTVVCAPSLFCLWPALANTNGNVHIATSSLVAAGKAAASLKSLHWIQPSMLQTASPQASSSAAVIHMLSLPVAVPV